MTVTVRSTTIITDYDGMLGVHSLRWSLICTQEKIEVTKEAPGCHKWERADNKTIKDKTTKGQTMIYNTLPRKLRIDN